MNASLATVLALIPRSDEKMALDIGISAKTIKRIKAWYVPSQRIRQIVLEYFKKLNITIGDFITNQKQTWL